MIIGHIENFDNEKGFYPLLLQKGLQYLKDTDFSKMSMGKYEIDGDHVRAIISEYFPAMKQNRQAETHRKYIDIQYIADGEETIGVANLSHKAEITIPYSEQKDIAFYKSVENEKDITLSKGMYGVFFPWDIHRPGCMSRPNLKVRKVIIKLKISELD